MTEQQKSMLKMAVNSIRNELTTIDILLDQADGSKIAKEYLDELEWLNKM